MTAARQCQRHITFRLFCLFMNEKLCTKSLFGKKWFRRRLDVEYMIMVCK